MKDRRGLIAAALVIGLLAAGVAVFRHVPEPERKTPTGTFVVEPYLQLGDAPALERSERLDLVWVAPDQDARWTVEVQTNEGGAWVEAGAPMLRRIALEGAPPSRLIRATLAGLVPGEEFAYRVRRDGNEVFAARGRARKPSGRAHRFVAFGDCGADTPGQKAVAYQTWLARPDFVMVTGDIVYQRGRFAEYLQKFFPVYNRSDASPEFGAPLMRSTLFVAAPGNHDLMLRNLNSVPDGLAYFWLWSQPLNGPVFHGGSMLQRGLRGSEARRQAFLDLAGPAFPRMANFSFDYGDVHWTILDANTYAELNTPALRDWVARDLASARGAAWRFVAFHHPPFHSSKAHADDQRMRVLAELFERGGVSIVFCGHVHNYQRSRPMRFVAKPEDPGYWSASSGRVGGRWTLDRTFDGRTDTTPDGIIYLVTGAGGAGLYNTEQHDDPASWQEYTARFVSKVHSLTVVDVEPAQLVVRQVSDRGDEVDRFVVTRSRVSDNGTMEPPRTNAHANAKGGP